MTCNGIDTQQLAALGELVTSNPDVAAVSACVRTHWEGGYTSRTSTEELTFGDDQIPRGATLPADLPEALGGDDLGPAPGEVLLAALCACVTQAFVEGAAITGTQIERLEISARGHLDLRGNAGVAGVRPGLSKIHLDVEVEADTDEAVLDELLSEALRRSPVADSLTAGVAIDASVRQPVPASPRMMEGE